MKKIFTLKIIGLLAGLIGFLSCAQKAPVKSPVGYDLTKPVKYEMPAGLKEISGVVFNKGNDDLIYAEEDEEGKVYFLKPGDKTAKYTVFKEQGDFEDIAISGQQVIILQSKGVLFTIPLSEIGKPKTDNVKKWAGLLPEGEFEGICAGDNDGQIYVLCKHCTIDKTSKQCSGFIFNVADDGSLKPSGNFKINVKHIETILGRDKINFHPSALSKSPFTHDWYILSSVNKLLVVADGNWKIREAYALDPGLFTQPEGITFDSQNNLYISNEGGTLISANILKFPFKKPAN